MTFSTLEHKHITAIAVVLSTSVSLTSLLANADEHKQPSVASHATITDQIRATCGPPSEALNRIAREVALRSLNRLPAWNMLELQQRARLVGEPHPGARAWSLRAESLEAAVVIERMEAWMATFPDRDDRLCGVATAKDSTLGESVAVVFVPVFADLLAPITQHVPRSCWITVDVSVREFRGDSQSDLTTDLSDTFPSPMSPAPAGKIVVLGPRGVPRTIPTHSVASRIIGRFMADRDGPWVVQVVAPTHSGPRPVIETLVRVGNQNASSQDSAPGEASHAGLPDTKAIVAMLNEARSVEGLQRLVEDPILAEVALAHVRSMIAAGVVSHDTGHGLPPARVAKAGISSNEVGENVSRASSPTLVHRALWESISHRSNMLHPRYGRVGVGAVRDASGMLWVAQVFAGS